MFNEFVYVLVEQEQKYMRTDTILLCVSTDRAELEELALSLWQEYGYDVFYKHYMLGGYNLHDAKEYADRVATAYAKSLMIVRVPVWK